MSSSACGVGNVQIRLRDIKFASEVKALSTGEKEEEEEEEEKPRRFQRRKRIIDGEAVRFVS